MLKELRYNMFMKLNDLFGYINNIEDAKEALAYKTILTEVVKGYSDGSDTVQFYVGGPTLSNPHFLRINGNDISTPNVLEFIEIVLGITANKINNKFLTVTL